LGILKRVYGVIKKPAHWSWKLTRWTWGLPGPFKLFTVPALALSILFGYIAYVMPVDGLSRLFMSSEPTILPYDGDAPDSNLEIVALGGASSSPSAQYSELLATFKKEAKRVLVVENAPEKFSDQNVIDAVVKAIDPKMNVIFIGASMGGLLSYDIIDTLQTKGDTRKFGVVPADAPMDGEDVTGVASALKSNKVTWLRHLFGYVANLWTPLIGLPPFEPGDVSQMSPNVNRSELEKSNASYENWKTTAWLDQGEYVFGHDPLKKLSNVFWVYIRSDGDEFVDGIGAHAKLQKSQGVRITLLHVARAGHISFHDWPGEYAHQFKTAIDELKRKIAAA